MYNSWRPCRQQILPKFVAQKIPRMSNKSPSFPSLLPSFFLLSMRIIPFLDSFFSAHFFLSSFFRSFQSFLFHFCFCLLPVFSSSSVNLQQISHEDKGLSSFSYAAGHWLQFVAHSKCQREQPTGLVITWGFEFPLSL